MFFIFFFSLAREHSLRQSLFVNFYPPRSSHRPHTYPPFLSPSQIDVIFRAPPIAVLSRTPPQCIRPGHAKVKSSESFRPTSVVFIFHWRRYTLLMVPCRVFFISYLFFWSPGRILNEILGPDSGGDIAARRLTQSIEIDTRRKQFSFLSFYGYGRNDTKSFGKSSVSTIFAESKRFPLILLYGAEFSVQHIQQRKPS